ncbi:helix-turn-helix domain-containing protein [Actinomycetospora atypica]|uniref:Helix-turn-helix domain-containing protein n=1 Tax=Actinomycetospora atypica TaxID=1290095 RepID=A0ABV9YJP2_9PSEU
MTGPRDVELARVRFSARGAAAVDGAVRPAVLASWERSQHLGAHPGGRPAPFVGHDAGSSAIAEAGEVLGDFVTANPECGCSVLLVGADGVVRARRDTDPGFGEVLDAVRLAPGYCHAERLVGTTAMSVALHEGRAVELSGPEHVHPELRSLAAAAAPVPHLDGVVVVCSDASAAGMLLPLARTLARDVTGHAQARRRRGLLALHEAFDAAQGEGGAWVVATDGDVVLVGTGARRTPPADQQALGDLAVASVVLDDDRPPRHVDLPSGTCAEVEVREVRRDGEYLGCVLTAGPAVHADAGDDAEARRRQGSHVAPTGRRDFAAALRGPGDGRAPSAARVRANRELLTPHLRARQEVAANLAQGRDQLLVGEPGTGKRTLAVEQFARRHRGRAPVVLDCSTIGDAGRGDPLARVVAARDGAPQLVVLRQLQAVSPVAVRRLDEVLRRVADTPGAVVLVGCLDVESVDPTRPYGLLLRRFHETVRVPALRHRIDELGEIARSVLGSMAAGRSLRLSHQVVRVLEGYPWPGNVSELEDVLRYVVARKPVGVIQPPDLPASCFTSRAPKLSMLETAQCDAIIQALYEARGNRYRAASMLGIARSSLYRKIDAFGISYIA